EVNQVVNAFRNAWSVREQTGRPASSLGFSLGGSTLLSDRMLGYQLSGTHSYGSSASLEQRRARAGSGGSEFDRYDGESGSSSTLWGGLFNLGFEPAPHSRISLKNSYNRSADNEARLEEGVDENTRSRVRVERLRYVERSVRSTQLTGEHQLGERQRFDWSLSSSGVSRREPDRSEFVTWLDPEVPVWFNDFEGAVRSFASLSEHILEGEVNHQIGFGGPSRPHLLRFGGGYRDSRRDANSQGFRIQAYFWSEDDPRWQQSPEEFFDGRYAGEDDANFLLSRELSGGSYTASDRLVSGYGMVEYALTDRVGLLGGARIEHSDVRVLAENQLGQPALTEPSYTDVLPALTLNIDLAERQKLRFAASRTLARPEYRELAPITYREVLGGEQVIGNRDLERTLIQNYDVRWEWYPAAIEVFSVGVFGKRFSNPIEQRFLARSGTNTRTFENAASATNYGIELEAVKGLSFIAERLSPLSVFTNVTLMRSSVDTGDEGDEARAMVGQAPYVLNSGVTFSDPSRAVSATLLFNVVGERIVNARASGTQVDDVVERPRNVVDLSLRFPFFRSLSGKLDAKNLLDAPHEIVQGTVTREFHRTGRSFSVGFTWTPML
ncbi:MAG: TonB-dependent receptor, partial [Gemmatimonadota bacterium]